MDTGEMDAGNEEDDGAQYEKKPVSSPLPSSFCGFASRFCYNLYYKDPEDPGSEGNFNAQILSQRNHSGLNNALSNGASAFKA